mmetsp:Transcript_87482/g.183093  ORF Transcript_87482/g.183093 Transcript_87482/m.183093 type:complete len:83 (+) Transcript_87482:88-336(+)
MVGKAPEGPWSGRVKSAVRSELDSLASPDDARIRDTFHEPTDTAFGATCDFEKKLLDVVASRTRDGSCNSRMKKIKKKRKEK